MYRYKSNAIRASVWRWLCACGLLLFWGSAPAVEQAALTWPTATAGYTEMNGRFAVLLSHSGAPSAAAVMAGRHDGEFVLATRDNTNPGFTNAHVWARFSIHYNAVDSAPPVLVLPKPLIDHVDFYAVDAARKTSQIRTGDAHPFATRPLAYRGFAFVLDAKPGETVAYYLHLRSATGPVGLPLQLVDSVTFRADSASENYLHGAYVGFMAGLAVCALVLFGLVRNVAYAYYCQYLVSFVLLVCAVDGYGMQFLWPNAPLAQQILPAALLALSNITGVLFTRSFLNLPVTTPSCEPLYALGVIASALGMGLHVLVGGCMGVMVIMAASAILCPIAMWGCLQAWRGGDRIVAYLLCGWLAFMLGMSLTLFDMTGIVSSSWWTTNGIYCGSPVNSWHWRSACRNACGPRSVPVRRRLPRSTPALPSSTPISNAWSRPVPMNSKSAIASSRNWRCATA